MGVSPTYLSFTGSAAYRDIYANKPGRQQCMKDPLTYKRPPNGTHSILSMPSDADQGRYRRLLANGFSERAMREQQALIKHYINLLIQRLHEHCVKSPQDVVAWYNWPTFDIIGDLTYMSRLIASRKRDTTLGSNLSSVASRQTP